MDATLSAWVEAGSIPVVAARMVQGFTRSVAGSTLGVTEANNLAFDEGSNPLPATIHAEHERQCPRFTPRKRQGSSPWAWTISMVIVGVW